ncbi:MAG: polyribonucleotide nucleotidyltransferase [Candidatus Lambdaproteobacteria bacterium RIFOXYD2_FULL_50_16]|uniref:Polyribonucleotide nucleotidyltransferase n=1 Tax=Candidatus Lambdaproteobacteria bacterium RIFOXYD2_FULL_50_16 TaxID=1817772 RepID=A0A1F6G4M5_9PROT|nr:MAG: polyribonucleotide nucleotidyltransferase [Candidatus Lambdaproteobacteria bacterium RIFOXYD2_FULL_50_16]
MKSVEILYLGKKLVLETEHIAKQANGSVMVKYGDTMVLVASTANKKANPGADFFPLTCMYQVKTYAQGRILGGFVKRERQPSDMETLISRMIDRPIRPLFVDGFLNETQVIATVVSYDDEANPAVAGILGASASLLISDIPYQTPIAAINVGRINGQWIGNPSPSQLLESDLDLLLVAKEDAIVMVEAGANGISEAEMLEALAWGHKAVLPLIELQKELRKLAGKDKWSVEVATIPADIEKKIVKAGEKGIKKALGLTEKMARYQALDEVKAQVKEELVTETSGITSEQVSEVLSATKKKIMRETIIKGGKRVDGRDRVTVRPIDIEVGILPRAHGSALFTRGETQALVVTTLGTKDDEQMVDDPSGLHYKSFYLHYNFPSYSVGECKRIGPPGRREIGHGNLAERGLKTLVPSKDSFPYTIRVVSEITESNGSSSMASVCGGSLSMMDAGVPMGAPVAGVAMGLISEGKDYAVLTDILGDEDHIGDMDFKVVGTEEGITALQMDIKIDGLSIDVLEEALAQAKSGRLHILGEMAKAMGGAREKINAQAPRFIQCKIPTTKIRDLIGPGGKVIKAIQAETGAKLDIDDSGIVNISSNDQESAEKALALVRELTLEVEIGAIYEGEIKKIVDFGAFVEILPNTQGLVHVSEISEERVENVEDVLSEGQVVTVKAIGRDKRGKLKLSMKAVHAQPE